MNVIDIARPPDGASGDLVAHDRATRREYVRAMITIGPEYAGPRTWTFEGSSKHPVSAIRKAEWDPAMAISVDTDGTLSEQPRTRHHVDHSMVVRQAPARSADHRRDSGVQKT
jgi:hypothetical protein